MQTLQLQPPGNGSRQGMSAQATLWHENAAPQPPLDVGGSSATHEPRLQQPVGSSVHDSAAANSPVAQFDRLVALGEQLAEQAGYAKAYEQLLHTKMRATLKRSTDHAIEQGNEQGQMSGSMIEIQHKLMQREQDLARMQQFVQGINALVLSLS